MNAVRMNVVLMEKSLLVANVLIWLIYAYKHALVERTKTIRR